MIVFFIAIVAIAILTFSSWLDSADNLRDYDAVNSLLPSGVLTLDEMRAKNIFPFFCASEHKMVWVQDPNDDEFCPWCHGVLIQFS